MAIDPKVKNLLQQLTSAIDASGTVPGPGVVPAPPANVLPWHRSPGAPYAPGENAADNPKRAKELAAQGIRVNGEPGSVQGDDREYALTVADYVALDTTTSADADAKVEGCLSCDKGSAIYQVILGQFNGSLKPGTGGRARLMYPNTYLADVIHQPGKPVGGNVA